MADVCDLVDDGVNVYIESAQALTMEVVSAAEATIELGALIAHAVVSQATASAARTDTIGKLVAVSATAAATVAQALTAVNLIADSARLRDTLLPYRSNLVADSATASVALLHSLPQTVSVAATAAATVSQPASLATLLADTASVSDRTLQTLVDTISKSATLAAGLSQILRTSNLVTSAATLQAAVSAGLLVRSLVEVAATASASRVDALSASNVVASDAFASGEIMVDTAGAWTALAESWAMSRWTDLPATSIGVVDGALLAGGDGLFALDGTDDDGSQFLARLDHGVDELRTPQLKHLSYAYLAGKALGKVALQVGDHDDGREVFWAYEFERETSSVREPMRTKLGRGHRARYFRFAIQSRTPFEAAELTIISDATSRKV